ncbi:histone-like nucleoid-structuring protein Lsr2 [Nigerium massiliense]|uniref:histone-like nucleoid-structuring protein Lsr2 n=1 Tax=Nigerium massiliense TaxID=1522317 RepID=UPI00058B1C0F|nr:Lsr2 family protein [Nigerium massiliense]
MAQRVHIVLTDDLDGSDAVETVTFGLDGNTYEIDLSEQNVAKLRDALQPYVAVARKVTTRRTPGKRRPSSDSSATDIRAWAQAQGMTVSSRGRVPAEIREAYEAAH